MKKLVLNVDDNTEKVKDPVKIPKCWVCMDQGFVYYYKKENGILYEMTARCTCIQGQKAGNEIPCIHHSLIEDIAKMNFEEFKRKYPKAVEELSKRVV